MKQSSLFDAISSLHHGERVLRVALANDDLGGMTRADLEQTAKTLRGAICHLIEEVIIKPRQYIG